MAVDYQEYITSPRWRRLRNAYIVVYKSRCWCCTKQHHPRLLNLHHLSYERLGHEADGDLELCCLKCHNDIHATHKLSHPFQPLEVTSNIVREIKTAATRKARSQNHGIRNLRLQTT